jgi:predicted transcriptional regulator
MELEKQPEPTYTIQELYDDLPISLILLGEKADLNEVTVARIRDGKPTRRTSVNKLLRVLSEVYGKPLTLRNVRGINVQINRRLEKREAKQQQQSQGQEEATGSAA